MNERTSPADDDDTAIGLRLRVCVARLSRLSRSASRAADLSPSQLAVLSALESAAEIRIGDLAAEQGITAPSATRIVQTLVERQLLERRVDPVDKRGCLICLTDLGRETIAGVRGRATDLITARLVEMSRSDRTKLRLAIAALEHLAGIDT